MTTIATHLTQQAAIRSSMDAQWQPCMARAATGGHRAPLLVALHHWLGDYRAVEEGWAIEAARRGWAYVQPDYRGPNTRPEACGSVLAQGDVLDAIHWAEEELSADGHRVLLAGVSGGGHMAMLLAALHPDRFAAVTAWVGISDLAAWHREHCHDGSADCYARSIEQCVGGRPGDSAKVDRQLMARSPVHHLAAARDLPIDLAAGIEDGHTGSVPIHHTLDAFNVIAAARGEAVVPPETIERLHRGSAGAGEASDEESGDSTFGGRRIYLRRHAGPARVTIFAGGHEALPAAGCAFLEQHL